ncbi:MAG: hypothetical protein ACREIF_06585 [Chthoniobacterales bacterium]
MMRIFLAGLLGGIAMFIWTSIAHMALPLGDTGVREMPNETIVLDTMQTNIGEKSGFYYFPGFGLGENPTREQKGEAMKHMDEALAHHPSGILIYHAAGSRPFRMASLLSVEFVTELIEAFLAVYLLTQTRLTSYGARVGFVTVIGIIAAIATNVSYWNWYGFPANYTEAYIFTQFIGFLCVGLVAGLVLKNQKFAEAR